MRLTSRKYLPKLINKFLIWFIWIEANFRDFLLCLNRDATRNQLQRERDTLETELRDAEFL